jgi:alkanesulfonate monooxygenase SsuD/methylene tetrahydromethanopterin reductase-like flavin-dependent oxidoreductase (luciferase family)
MLACHQKQPLRGLALLTNRQSKDASLLTIRQYGAIEAGEEENPMKFMYFMLPTLPATLEERKTLRPIASHPERWQQMIKEVVEVAQVAEDVGFEAVTFPEHHLHSEGIEMGSLPVLTQHVIHNTKRIKVGPIGYVLPGWNPLRLALEIAWLDQLTKGRTLVGFARGYQARWLNQMAQKIHVGATSSDKSETDRINREAFEEVFRFLKLAWGDEPFRFKGKYYEYPYPQEGTPWPAHEWTREYGFPGEVDELGRIQKINVVPKPYQRPHPPLFQAFSVSEETVRWCAREGIIPSILLPQPSVVRALAEAYCEESRKAGHNLNLGDQIGVLHAVYLADNKESARALGRAGVCGVAFGKLFHHFGFSEAWRVPEDESRYPAGKVMLPASEVTIERQERCGFAYAGTVDDVRREMDAMVENVHPEWFILEGDQGFIPIEEVKRQIITFGKQVLPRYA